VIKRFEQKGFTLVGMKLVAAKREVAEAHYAEHKGKKFYDGLVNFITSGPIVVMVWQGLGVVAASRLLIGATRPLESAPGTIRGDYGIDVGRNIIHGSDSNESAKREIALWFRDDELAHWKPTAGVHIYESAL